MGSKTESCPNCGTGVTVPDVRIYTRCPACHNDTLTVHESSTQKTDAETPTGDNWRVAAIPGVGDFRARCLIAGIETAEACDRAADGERKLLARSGVLDALAARRRKIRETTKGA